MRRAWRRLAALPLVALLLVAPLTVQAADTLHSLWSVKGAHNTVYLLGSVHLLKPSDSDLAPAIEKAYAAAKGLVMEVDLNDATPDKLLGSNLDQLMLPPGQTLAQALGPDVYAKFLAQAKPAGLDPDFMQSFQPWFAAMTLEQVQLARLGFDPAAGVDQQLARRATADGKKIIALETLEEQLGFFAHLSPDQQRQFMLYSLDEAAELPAEMDAVVTAWRRGDTAVLERLLGEGAKSFPDLFRTLTTDRNRKWLPTLTGLLKQHDDHLVVVGALHLVGKDGVIDLLRKQGYVVVQQ